MRLAVADRFSVLGVGDELRMNLVGTGSAFLRGLSVEGIVKWFMVAGLLMYAVFSVVVVRQAMVMTGSLETEINGWVKLLAWLHLLAALALVGVAIVVL